MVWKKIKTMKDLSILESIENSKIRVAKRNIGIIRRTKKNIKRGDSYISINISK